MNQYHKDDGVVYVPFLPTMDVDHEVHLDASSFGHSHHDGAGGEQPGRSRKQRWQEASGLSEVNGLTPEGTGPSAATDGDRRREERRHRWRRRLRPPPPTQPSSDMPELDS